MKKILMIIAPEGFRDEEYFVPKQNFENVGYQVITASSVVGKCVGKLGGEADSQLMLSSVEVSEFDAIVFIGGPGSVIFQKDNQAHKIIAKTIEQNKILAGICIAPIILAYSGVLEDKNATVWNGDGKQSEIFSELKIKYIDEDVVVDGNIITANGPSSAEEFSKNIIKELGD